ncbi:MAG: hypothetical protein HZA53_06920 [Planctomycetes bacterium]|nr:hypothetical protein [Planctomycetota bacterium]
MDKRRSEPAFRVRAEDEQIGAAALALARELASLGERAQRFVELAGVPAFVKASPLTGAARLRWTLKACVLRSPLPREREYGNLRWLRERLFLAPEPLVTVIASRAGAPCFQMLATRAVEGARTLEEHLREEPRDATRPLVLELAAESARMHALHFVHRDLFPRNVLVKPEASGGALWFLDCWKGGERLQLRGPEYDLACFLLRAPEWLGAELQHAFLEHYFAERAAQGRPVANARRFTERVERERATLVRRIHQRPAEARGLGAPIAEWRIG